MSHKAQSKRQSVSKNQSRHSIKELGLHPRAFRLALIDPEDLLSAWTLSTTPILPLRKETVN